MARNSGYVKWEKKTIFNIIHIIWSYILKKIDFLNYKSNVFSHI